MELKEINEKFIGLSGIDASAQILRETNSRLHWGGHVGSSNAFCAAAVAKQIPGHHLFLLTDKEEAAYFLNDLQNVNPDNKKILFLPDPHRLPYQVEDIDNSHVVERAEVLEALRQKKNVWVVTYPLALFDLVPTIQKLIKNTLKIELGKEYSISFMNELLMEYHFDRVDFVYEPGQYAIRGGIVDVYSFSNDLPFRIEFFGDEVESIRVFNPVDQLSLANHKHFQIVPNIHHESFTREGLGNFLAFLGEQTTIWTSDFDNCAEVLDKAMLKAEGIYGKMNQDFHHTTPAALFLDGDRFKTQLEKHNSVEWGPSFSFDASHKIDFNFVPQPSFNKRFELLREDLMMRSKKGYKCAIFSNQPKQIERLEQILEDIGGKVEFSPVPHALNEGFISPELELACYTDHQIFERYHRFQLKDGFRSNKQALMIKDIYNLQKGDYITHIDHGVGQFSGLETIDVNGKPQEAIRLLYKDGDVLYVGIHSLHRISKFTGKEGVAPKMNKLGTQAWNTLKNKTKKKIKELAYDLIQLYAKRKAQPGFAFAPDNYLQNELELSFMYEDTPDQGKATAAVKADMESATPMDRLICGDVGFGKTEIAVRAAFKAVNDSKQVAILVPTTILSMQHFRSFKERLKDFPCTVDYLNRFKSQKKITETLKKLEAGEIDIIIGTHALVGSKVKFKDLGLMIIDEEQKFGVSVKDKLKTLRASVDTLTLTATPIPRTLQFSLMGARDLSIINTPPPNRQPVLTEIISFNEEIIRDAIAYEVGRGGQVFFIHNRLANIKEVAGMISRLCPGVRIGIGHGQMDGEKLEKIMLDFIEHEYDVLLATTIVESGIDISNANTIIINNAQNFGISDLHQLRGRVGRSNKKGFCYLIAPKFSQLTSEGRKRLEALVQFSDLGSGFNIAMKDLDIRGAGNMLGGEQSGFISEIGFEMYQKILNEAVDELKESEFKELFENPETTDDHFVRDCVLETDQEVRLPDTYVNEVNERLSLYRAMDELKTKDELITFSEQLIDRFGPLPEEAEHLMNSFELRWLAQDLGFEKLVIKGQKMVGFFVSDQQSKFFESDVFQAILSGMQKKELMCSLSEKNNRLKLIFQNVSSINNAKKRLEALFS
jgi:transcription-repair coupling factor (superfamily II helicase)